jgi:exodeoxyribonuclease VII small subunit
MAKAKLQNEMPQDTFEQLYARLEDRVGKLEQGGLPLDQSIALYEEGMELARRCQDRLDAAEQKITKLRESFAALPARPAAAAHDAPADYEYVSDDEPPIDEDEPFG